MTLRRPAGGLSVHACVSLEKSVEAFARWRRCHRNLLRAGAVVNEQERGSLCGFCRGETRCERGTPSQQFSLENKRKIPRTLQITFEELGFFSKIAVNFHTNYHKIFFLSAKLQKNPERAKQFACDLYASHSPASLG